MPDWPLASDLGPVGALPTAPRLARGFLDTMLWIWGMTEAAEVAELLISELTTNAVQAATREDGTPRYDPDGGLPVIWVRLLSDRSQLLLEVWDNIPTALGAPVVRHPDLEEEHGRGLELIDSLAEDWGWESVPSWHGKRVWAVIKLPR